MYPSYFLSGTQKNSVTFWSMDDNCLEMLQTSLLHSNDVTLPQQIQIKYTLLVYNATCFLYKMLLVHFFLVYVDTQKNLTKSYYL